MPERAARLTAPGSALVADLSQKIVAPRDACFALDASRREAVYDAEDTASLLSFGQHNLCWIGGRAEDAADLRNHLDRIEYIDRVEAIAQKNDKAVACRERQRILARELLEAGVSAGPAHQTLARRFTECEPEADS